MAEKLASCIKDFIFAMLDIVGITAIITTILPNLKSLLQTSVVLLQQELFNYDIVSQVLQIPIQATQTVINVALAQIGQIPVNRFRSCPPVNDFIQSLESTLDESSTEVAEEQYRVAQITSIKNKTQRTIDSLNRGVAIIGSMLDNLTAIAAGIESSGVRVESSLGKELLIEEITKTDFEI